MVPRLISRRQGRASLPLAGLTAGRLVGMALGRLGRCLRLGGLPALLAGGALVPAGLVLTGLILPGLARTGLARRLRLAGFGAAALVVPRPMGRAPRLAGLVAGGLRSTTHRAG